MPLAQILEGGDRLHPTDILRNCKAISGTPKISKKFFSESVGIPLRFYKNASENRLHQTKKPTLQLS